MEGASLKLSCPMVVLLAFASFLSPYTAERIDQRTLHKNCHLHGRRPAVSPPQAPTLATAPAPAPTPKPYEDHGLGYPCVSSHVCDWPRLICGQNHTCIYNERFLAPLPYSTPESCGWQCIDSNECSAPCTVCVDGICGYEDTCGWSCEDSTQCVQEMCTDCCNECCPDKTCCKKADLALKH